jgi:hypothetical protein
VLLGGLWLQNSLSAQNRIIRSNSKNTVKYVINYDTTYNTPTPYDPSLPNTLCIYTVLANSDYNDGTLQVRRKGGESNNIQEALITSAA